MSEYLEQIQELVDYSHAVEDNLTKVNFIEAAIKIADSHQDIEEGFELRIYLITTLNKCGYPEKLLTAFSWCLAQWDKNPERFRFTEEHIMWIYKWIVEHLPNFPQISRQQIENTFTDMKDRYLRAGKSLRAVYQKRSFVEILMGNRDLAIQYYQKWQDIARDSSSDCAGCELSEEIDLMVFTEQYERAINKAQPIISGKLKCSELPHLTLSRLLIPLIKLEQLETGVEYHLKSLDSVSGNNKYLTPLAEHILFLSLTNNKVKAITLLEQNIEIALTTTSLIDRFYFYRAAYYLMDYILDKVTEEISLLLPETFPLYSSDSKYQVKELADWFKSQAEIIAEQLNRRNGNTFYTEQLAELAELQQYQTDYPLHKEIADNNLISLNVYPEELEESMYLEEYEVDYFN